MESLASVERQARERLYPGLTNPSWLVLRRRREIFKKWISALPGNQFDVLDVGGRIQPYRPLLESRARRYVALDLRQTPVINLVASAEHIPFASETFDLVICTQVLEYVRDPAAVIQEIHRVLKIGGCLLLSAPAIFPRDSDEDRWRFLPPGLAHLLRDFQDVQIVAEGSNLSSFFRTLCVFIVQFARPAFIIRMLQLTLIPVLNSTAALLEMILPNSNDEFSANFSARARK